MDHIGSDIKANLEYQKGRYHKDSNENVKKGRTDNMENDVIHIDVSYKKKKVKVHLEFPKEQDHKNAEIFYDGLKKIYIEKIILSL